AEDLCGEGMGGCRGHICGGTSRNSLALLKLFPPQDAPAMDPWPVPVPASVEDLDLRAQVWRLDVRADRWERVYRAPKIVGRNGRRVPRDLAYRGMAVFQGVSDDQ